MLRRIAALLLFLAVSSHVICDCSAVAQNRRKKAAPKKKVPAKPKTNLPIDAARTKIEIEPLSRTQRDRARVSAERIDVMIEKELKKVGRKSNPRASDEQFVRRVYLDITGTIPTAKQTVAFLRSKSDSSRFALIDALLSRPGYASHAYNYWADVLRIVDKVNNNTYLRPYGQWVKQSLRENRPWDEMAHAMITANGKVWEDPAVGFVLRDQGMPLDNLNNMVRTFLGTRIGCAQCHDHPFDRWTQKEFYQLAAFVGGTEYRVDRVRKYKLNDKAIEKSSPGMKSPEYRNGRTILRYNRAGIFENAKRHLRFPADYQYDDAKPKDLVKPAVLFGSGPVIVKPEERRKHLADWITSRSNDRFAKTIANRLWKRVMGVGLFEPVDDLTDDTEPSHPELLNFLASEMLRLRFNMREFQRILHYTRTYQRQAAYEDLDPNENFLFPGPVLKRMTAEQVWDSLLTLTMPEPDEILRPSDDEYVATLDISAKTTAQQVVQQAKKLDAFRKDENKARNLRMNRPTTEAMKGSVRLELMRASELPQPLPEGHFLRQFGQSSREIIADSHTDGTVPQLLTMFNGPITHLMLDPQSVLVSEVMDRKSMEDRAEMMFLCLLSRYPTEDELKAALLEMRSTLRNEEYKYAGHGNVIWALLNTREFLFIQ